MKKIRIFSALLALILSLSAVLPALIASAAPTPVTGTITIAPPDNGNIANTKYYAYKLFDVIYNAGQTSFVYTVDSAFDTFTYSPDGGVTTYDKTDIVSYIEGLTTNSDAINALAAALWNFIDTEEIPATASADGTETPAWEMSGLDLGYYLVYGKTISDGVEIVAACSLTTTVPTATIHPKVDVPFIDKWVKYHDTNNWVDKNDVNIGDTVTFKHDSAVPNMIGYTTYTYIVHDIMSPGLTFNDDVAVEIDSVPYEGFTVAYRTIVEADVDGEDDDDIVNATAADIGSTYITITFNNFIAQKANAGDAIEIIYTAELNGDAVIGDPGNPNRVYLEYSVNPYDDSETGTTPEDEVFVFTFDLEIYKFAVDGEGDDYPLEDAEFELTNLRKGGLVRVIQTTGKGYYRLATPEEIANDVDDEVTTTLISNDEGTIYIKGLDEGTYELEETKAPDGYVGGLVTTIVIDFNSKDNSYSITANAEPTDVVNVENTPGSKLPETGGIGRTIFYVLGALFVMGVVTAAFAIRRKVVLQGIKK